MSNPPSFRDKKPPNFLRAWRDAAGFTQAQVEKKYGWKQGKLSTLERNMAHLTPELRGQLAAYYFCTPNELLSPPPKSRVDAGFGTDTESQGGVAALDDTLALLKKLRSEMRFLRKRLDILEPQLDTAVEVTAKAVRDASDLVAMFERGANTLKRTIRQPVANEPSSKTAPAPESIRADSDTD